MTFRTAAAIVTLVFVLLTAAPLVMVRRSRRTPAVVRRLVGALVVAAVLVCWWYALVPRTVAADGGRYTCLDSPVLGLALDNEESPPCVRTNRAVVEAAGAGAASAVLLGAVVLRVTERGAGSPRSTPARAGPLR